MDKKPSVQEIRQKQLRLRDAYKNLFSSKEGKIVLDDLKDMFERRSSVVPGDPYATHAKEGAREVCIYIDMMTGEFDNEKVS